MGRIRFFYNGDSGFDSNVVKLGEMQIFLDLYLITFYYNGQEICNPLADESDQFQVLPSEYYGKAYLESDFLDEKKVKEAIREIEFYVDEVLKEYARKNKLNFYYDIMDRKYVISNHDFTQRSKTKIQLVLHFDLVEELKKWIKKRDEQTNKQLAVYKER